MKPIRSCGWRNGLRRRAAKSRGWHCLSLVAQPRTGAPALSFAQERLWFLEQLESLGATYHEAMAFRLEGAADVGALERASVS